MTDKHPDDGPANRLHCFHGNPPPAPVVDGWRRFMLFPAAARQNFWRLLGPALLEPADSAHGQRIQAFGQEFALKQEDVVAALRSCDLLMRQACGLDLTAEQLQQDLSRLSAGPPEAANVLLAQYAAVKSELRKQIVQHTLADHGKLLVGIDWRLDQVTASQRGDQLNTQVIFLTLRYRQAERLERVTFQLTAEAMQHLKRFCDRFAE